MRSLHATMLSLAAVALCACSAQRLVIPATDPSLPYSRAIMIGRTAFIAGHLGLDPATRQPPSDPAAEAEQMLDAFTATLGEVGMKMDDLVQVQLYCSDVSLYDIFNGVYRERFSRGFPTRAFIGSGPLVRGARFEMQGIAVRR